MDALSSSLSSISLSPSCTDASLAYSSSSAITTQKIDEDALHPADVAIATIDAFALNVVGKPYDKVKTIATYNYVVKNWSALHLVEGEYTIKPERPISLFSTHIVDRCSSKYVAPIPAAFIDTGLVIDLLGRFKRATVRASCE